MDTLIDQVPTFDDIEAELLTFEAAERRKLGLDEPPVVPWHDPHPQEFRRDQRDATTLLIGGLTLAHDVFLQAALQGLGYRVEVLDCPDTQALHLGKEFGNRGQCNPTYFTVGNLIKHLVYLRDVAGMPVTQIVRDYLFVTAGSCGPCRFGTYVTEYRKALRDAGFEGFRVLLFQQTGGLKQATGSDAGLEFTPRLFLQFLKAFIAGDVLNAIGYRLRPYEVVPGATDAALQRANNIVCDAFRRRSSIVLALRRARREFAAVKVDRSQPKPRIMIIGEFWAMTTEGDGNYRLQRFLESEGAEVIVQPIAGWILYLIWQTGHDIRRRIDLRGVDEARKGLAGKSPRRSLWALWLAERAVRGLSAAFARAVGLSDYHLADMQEIADLAGEHYDVELRGGEGHMEVGKLIECVRKKKAHLVVSVKPFGCMPSSGVSDGVQQAVLARHPEALFCAVETTGDGAVNFQSRVQMFLFKARQKARAEVAALPRHDDFSFSRRAFSVLSIAAAACLLLWNVIRLSNTTAVSPRWLPPVILGGMLAADFLSGLVHWAADTWGSETMPVIGRRLLHPFRVHHVNPDDFLRRRFIDTNGDVAFMSLPILIALLALPLENTWQVVAAVFATAFCAIGLLTNQVHQWAHMPDPPRLVRALQDWGMILGRAAHHRHHAPPYATNYCIATGWCNRPLSAIDFFRRLERAVTALCGLKPRDDEATFQSQINRALTSDSADTGGRNG